MVEVRRTKKVQVTDSSEIYYEFGDVMKLGHPGTSSAYHKGESGYRDQLLSIPPTNLFSVYQSGGWLYILVDNDLSLGLQAGDLIVISGVGATGILVNNGSGYSSGSTNTIAVDTVDPTNIISPGSTIIDSAGNVVGIANNIATNSIEFFSNITEALADDEQLFLQLNHINTTHVVGEILLNTVSGSDVYNTIRLITFVTTDFHTWATQGTVERPRQACGKFTKGDVYYKQRKMLYGSFHAGLYLDYKFFNVESYYLNDWFKSDSCHIGRPHMYIPNAGEQKRISEVSYSGKIIEGTTINGLSNFNGAKGNFKNINSSYGSIQLMKEKDGSLSWSFYSSLCSPRR